MLIVDDVLRIHDDVAVADAEDVNLPPFRVIMKGSPVRGGCASAKNRIIDWTDFALPYARHLVGVEEAIGDVILPARQRDEQALIVPGPNYPTSAARLAVRGESNWRQCKQRRGREKCGNAKTMVHGIQTTIWRRAGNGNGTNHFELRTNCELRTYCDFEPIAY
jgi:hypothetical protein